MVSDILACVAAHVTFIIYSVLLVLLAFLLWFAVGWFISCNKTHWE
jgi:hypothetical protein